MFYGNNKVLQSCGDAFSLLPLVGACTGPHSQHFGLAHTLKASTDPSLTLKKNNNNT